MFSITGPISPWALVLVLITRAYATPLVQDGPQSPVHIIAARGSYQDPGPGSIGQVAQNIASQVRNSTIAGVDYPATNGDPPYMSSVHTGAVNLQRMIRSIIAADTNASIVLLGYSQGAQVVGDAICGASSPGSITTSALARRFRPQVKAVVWMGDPSHNSSQPFVIGGGYHSGTSARRENVNCLGFHGKLRSFCIEGDVYCDSGTNASAHVSYQAMYAQQAADWVVTKLM